MGILSDFVHYEAKATRFYYCKKRDAFPCDHFPPTTGWKACAADSHTDLPIYAFPLKRIKEEMALLKTLERGAPGIPAMDKIGWLCELPENPLLRLAACEQAMEILRAYYKVDKCSA